MIESMNQPLKSKNIKIFLFWFYSKPGSPSKGLSFEALAKEEN